MWFARSVHMYFNFIKLLESSVHTLQKGHVLAPFSVYFLFVVMAQYSIKMGLREENWKVNCRALYMGELWKNMTSTGTITKKPGYSGKIGTVGTKFFFMK